MAYRDDREALRARAEALEQERDDARRKLERVRRESREPPDRRPWRVALGSFVVGNAIGVSLIGLLLVGAVGWWAFAREGASVSRAASPGAPSDRRVLVVWTGRVEAVEGRDLAVGAPCTLTGELTSRGTSPMRTDVSVDCGGASLYRGADSRGESARTPRCDVEERSAGPPGTFRYSLRCRAPGAPSGGRPRLTVDTRAGRATVLREAPPTFRVDIAVEERSEPREGPPLLPGKGPGGSRRP